MSQIPILAPVDHPEEDAAAGNREGPTDSPTVPGTVAPAVSGYRLSHGRRRTDPAWYLRYGLSYRDVEELLVERGVEVDDVSVFRWVQRFTPHRAIGQHGQVLGVLVSAHRDAAAARKSFRRALATLKVKPSEVVTDAARVYPTVLDSHLCGTTSSSTRTIR